MSSIRKLQDALERHATARSREWWTRYLKGEAEFRGVGIPMIRDLVTEWRDANAPIEEQFETALALIREPITEDKLAGVLYLQEFLAGALPWRDAIPRYAALFDDGFIRDWNVCDWFCVRVLGPTIARNDLACARAVAAWRTAANLWRARASAVAFVNLAGDARFHDLIERSCGALIARDERFAKTAVGWVMRELSKHDPDRVKRFVRKHEGRFSRESRKSATKFLR